MYETVRRAQGGSLGGDIFGGQQPGHQGSPGMISMASPIKPQQMGHPGMHGGKEPLPDQAGALLACQRCQKGASGNVLSCCQSHTLEALITDP